MWQNRLKASRSINVARNHAVDVPAREDYIQALIEEGLLFNESDLAFNPDLACEIHRHWLSQPQVGCRYAQGLSHESSKYGGAQISYDITDGEDVEQIAANITADVVSASKNPKLQALSILLPGLTELQSICTLVFSLTVLNEWTFRCGGPYVRAENLEPYALFGMDFLLPDGVPSAVLGLGPSTAIPATRQSPIYSLELRMKSENAQEISKRAGSPVVSHLAQIPYPGPGELAKREDPMWQSTSKLRLSVLGENDPRAKAEVTFAFPWRLWQGALTGA